MTINFQYPLQWKPTIPRTQRRIKARFQTNSVSYAGDRLVEGLRMMGAKNCIISSNLQLRQRGDGFYANQRVDDVGVCVYFDLKGQQKVMALDLYDKVEHNLWALYLSVEAMRGIQRWGGAQIMDGIFTGFAALPSPDSISQAVSVQYFADCVDADQARQRYLRLAKELHPDLHPESLTEFQEMKRQYEAFK